MIVEDGSGIVDANSYATLEEAEQYFIDRNKSICALSEGDLIAGTEYVDAIFGCSYLGNKLTTPQGLLFPRTAFYNIYGDLVQAGTIPKELKIAVYHASILHADGVGLYEENPDSKLQSISQSVEGAVSQSKTWFAPVSRSQTKTIGIFLSPILSMADRNRTSRA